MLSSYNETHDGNYKSKSGQVVKPVLKILERYILNCNYKYSTMQSIYQQITDFHTLTNTNDYSITKL